MCHLMDHCLDRLQLAHIRFDDYLPVSIVLFFKLDFVLAWSDYLDAFLTFAYLSAMIFLPCLVPQTKLASGRCKAISKVLLRL